MKPLRKPANAERWAVDTVTEIVKAVGSEKVGTDLPGDWTKAGPMFVQVADDGNPGGDWPVRTTSTIRVTVWGNSPTKVFDLAGAVMGRLLATPGVREGTGLLRDKDPRNGGTFASFTVLVSLRTVAA